MVLLRGAMESDGHLRMLALASWIRRARLADILVTREENVAYHDKCSGDAKM